MKGVTIVGLGWLGEPLALGFQQLGYQVTGTVTSLEKAHRLVRLGVDARCWLSDGTRGVLDDECFTESMVLTLPPSRCPDYLGTIDSLCRAAAGRGCRHVLYVSSTSVYGRQDAGTAIVSPHPDDERGRLVLDAEAIILASTIPGVTILRSAGQYGPGRYPGRFLSGKRTSSGGAPVNLVHLDDLVSIILAIFQQEAWGKILNACSPHHPTRADFYSRACSLIGLPTPEFSDLTAVGKLIDGSDTEKTLGFSYQHADLYQSLAQCL